jgi:hypothetical protein
MMSILSTNFGRRIKKSLGLEINRNKRRVKEALTLRKKDGANITTLNFFIESHMERRIT